MVPPIQWLPCRIPKAADDANSASHVKPCGETDSKSGEMTRRMRNPRNASSSAIGTVTTEARTRTAIQVFRPARDALASADGIALPLFEFTRRSSAIQMTKTTAPAAGANHPNLQSRVFIYISGYTGKDVNTQTHFDLQTTISERI